MAALLGTIPAAHSQNAVTKPDFHQWATTPPMGWNSWDCYGPTVTEAEVKANADYMARNLKSSGWEYVVVDIRWYVGNDTAHGYNEKNPDWNLDEYGRFVPAVNRFPSAAGGKGFKPLADYLHSKGLKFGIHIMRGVPVVAVQRRLPILGTKLTAADIYSKEGQARWLHDMYTVKAGPGAQEYYDSLFKLYAAWGLDFVKVDDLSEPYHKPEVEMIRRAIDKSGRRIVFSTSPGETPIAEATHVATHANMWRTVGDFWDSWEQLKEHFAVCARWASHIRPGAFPDADMLPLGRLGIRAERGDDRMTRFTPDEQRTLMTLWSIFRSPLMFGGDLPSNDAATLALITNPRVLAVNQRSTHNRQLFRRGDLVAWTADDPATGDKFLALFNAQDQELAPASEAAWASGPITRQTPAKTAEVDLAGATKLYLTVRDGGDGTAWDHADWLNPILLNSDGKPVPLTTRPWRSATAGWGKPAVNKSVSGGPLLVAGKAYETGIGTHANSIIEYDLPAGTTRLSTTVGLDNAAAGQNTGGTLDFLVFTKSPFRPAPADSVRVPVALQELGATAGASVQDLWTGRQIGKFTTEFAPYVRRHGAALYRISIPKK
ncbi:NPCBM/NEW2 domain-containing protein [Microvirga sp. STS02]|uniref:NPCBM/NEW2 domain-containing protein n=1 Tax=Hymenobacter negativus TaxID=2795026 RepID=UPI0018DCF1DB|nr:MULTISPECIES: NPCBM/NEW2 domain-containing protein [Bacteria]MBH8567718.1 NPCBM/NEW2 domain-containing protein [Hymenobacter negativus]MBR7207452.1 NPCBM/NEW2 domain-containing protein [Microvirga sp. STS02]